MIKWLHRMYRRIGIHAAPPGTLLFMLHTLARRLFLRRIFGFVSGNPYTRGKFGGIPYYDIKMARKTRPVSGIALVYFMGAGDYLMTTPLVRSLHQAHPDLPIYAYASTHTDEVNSPLVIQLLKANPLIDQVFTYAGRPRSFWIDYDFSDALKSVPKDFLTLPVFYDVEPVVYHRATSVLETFGLPVDLPVPAPIAYQTEMSEVAQGVLASIRSRIGAVSPSCIVCTHFGARSSGYEYPYAKDLVGRLTRLGCLVISFSGVELTHDNLVQIDITRISATDSIEILRALATGPDRLYMISVNSLMWPITAALNILNLGLHTFKDITMHQYLYPNIFVVTQFASPHISPSRWFLPPKSAYVLRTMNGGPEFTDYKPDFVVDSFETMRSLDRT